MYQLVLFQRQEKATSMCLLLTEQPGDKDLEHETDGLRPWIILDTLAFSLSAGKDPVSVFLRVLFKLKTFLFLTISRARFT